MGGQSKATWERDLKPKKKIWIYSGQMAQRVSVRRKPSHMAKLAQNQNQSHKTIGMGGEEVGAAGLRMPILYHWELGQPDGAEGARQKFHRRKMDFAPFHLFRRTSLPATWLVGFLRDSLSRSLCLWFCWSLCLEGCILCSPPRHPPLQSQQPAHLTLLSFSALLHVLSCRGCHKAPTLFLPPCLDWPSLSFFFFSILFMISSNYCSKSASSITSFLKAFPDLSFQFRRLSSGLL